MSSMPRSEHAGCGILARTLKQKWNKYYLAALKFLCSCTYAILGHWRWDWNPSLQRQATLSSSHQSIVRLGQTTIQFRITNCIPNAWRLQYLEKVHAERPQSASEPRTFMLRGVGVAHHDADASLMEDIYSPVYQTVIRIAEIWQCLRPDYYWELQRELPSLTIKCNAHWYWTISFAHTLPAEIFLSTLCFSLHLFFGDIFPPGS